MRYYRQIPYPCGVKTDFDRPEYCNFAHNSHFDRTILNYACIKINIFYWRDTIIRALTHCLPGVLAVLCEVLGEPTDKAKDKVSKALLQRFVSPRPKNLALRWTTGKTHPKEWKSNIADTGLDIEAMYKIIKCLPAYREMNSDGNTAFRTALKQAGI